MRNWRKISVLSALPALLVSLAGCGGTEIERSILEPRPVVVDPTGSPTPAPTITPTPEGTSVPTATPTPEPTATPTPLPSVPADPTDLVANLVISVDRIHVTLTWKDNSTNEDYFAVDRRKMNSTVIELLEEFVPHGTTTYQDFTIEGGPGFCYRVRAWNASGSSLPTNEACVTPPL